MLPKQQHAGSVRIRHDDIVQPVAVDVARRQLTVLAGPARSVTNQATNFGFVSLKLRRKLLQPVRRPVDGEDGSRFVFRSCEDRAEPAGVFDFKFHLRPEVAGLTLESHAEDSVGTARQVGPAVSVEVEDLRLAHLIRRVEQPQRRAQLAVLTLKQHKRLAFAEYHDIVAFVSVQVSRRENLRRRRHTFQRNADAIPFSLGLLQSQHQPIRGTPVSQIGFSIAIEIASDHIGNRLVDDQLLVGKQHGAGELVDVARDEFRLPILGLPLQKNVNPAVPVI